MINKIINDENLQEYFNQLAQRLISVPAKGGMGSGSWKYLKQELEKASKNRKSF